MMRLLCECFGRRGPRRVRPRNLKRERAGAVREPPHSGISRPVRGERCYDGAMGNLDVFAAFKEFCAATGPGRVEIRLTIDPAENPDLYPMLYLSWEPCHHSRGVAYHRIPLGIVGRAKDPQSALIDEMRDVGRQIAEQHARHLATLRPMPA